LRAEHLGSIRVVAEPERMLLYSECNLAEAVIARVAGGNMASINGSGGVLPIDLPELRLIRHRK
jgi:hypothetical protein